MDILETICDQIWGYQDENMNNSIEPWSEFMDVYIDLTFYTGGKV